MFVTGGKLAYIEGTSPQFPNNSRKTLTRPTLKSNKRPHFSHMAFSPRTMRRTFKYPMNAKMGNKPSELNLKELSFKKGQMTSPTNNGVRVIKKSVEDGDDGNGGNGLSKGFRRASSFIQTNQMAFMIPKLLDELKPKQEITVEKQLSEDEEMVSDMSLNDQSVSKKSN